MKAGVTEWLYVGHPRSTLRVPQGERPLSLRVSGPSAPGRATTRSLSHKSVKHSPNGYS